MKYNSMGETEEWMDDLDFSEDEQVDYYNVEEYINGISDNDELSEDPDWFPPDVPEEVADPDWWDDVADPDYVPKVPEAVAVVIEVYPRVNKIFFFSKKNKKLICD